MIRGEPLLRRVQALSRLCSGKGDQHVRCVRTFSVTDAVNALRPFYLAVHPDFFGQHPTEREVNENSLKKLNYHLECLQRPGHRALQATQLTFYVRVTAGNASITQCMNTSGFRAVSVTLQSQDLLSTVVNILKSCSLSIDHVQDSKRATDLPHQDRSIPLSRPIRWDKTYYAFTGFRDPEEELDSAHQLEPTLRLWLNKNVSVALERLSVSQPLREDLKRLKTELCQQLEVTDIRGSSAPILLKTGQLRVPITCDPTTLQWFILNHAQTARAYLRKEEELKTQQEKIIKVCTERFWLKGLYKEQSVSSEQMVQSCKRLLEEHMELPRIHLCISYFYSVLQDGDLCIPWDWKY